jgi:hypothetical protein
MTTSITTTNTPARDGVRPRRRRAGLGALLPLAAMLAACGADRVASANDSPVAPVVEAAGHDHGAGHEMRPTDRAAVMLATAGFQDVAAAEAAGYVSSIDTLGCFQDPAKGGMGLHLIKQDLLDARLDPTKPEALVYELGRDGSPVGLVGMEYIVPVDAWSSSRPPRLFGVDLHRHPTLPLWVLHAWLWKDNPSGTFADWNPAVRLCPSGVPIFGIDLPQPPAD